MNNEPHCDSCDHCSLSGKYCYLLMRPTFGLDRSCDKHSKIEKGDKK